MHRHLLANSAAVAGAAAASAVVLTSAASAHSDLHGWDTVSDFMGMHGSYPHGNAPTADSVQFAADHYAIITVGTGCAAGKVNTTHTIEQSVLTTATRLKARNPAVRVGMYWRSDFAMELADCSDYSAEWAAHPEWHLRMDNGTVLQRGNYFYLDYTQPALRDFFARVLVNVSTAQLPPARAGSSGNAAGGAVLDYIFIDGDPDEGATQRYLPGIGPARSTAIVEGMYATFGDVQQQLEARGQGQSVVLNGCDTQWVRDVQVGSGAAASMFDHWSILQFVNKTDGSFALEAMDTAFRMATAPNASNASLHVKGWPGPIVGQRDVYPANLPQPKTPADFQREAAERFNSELALFLLVASARDFWTYSWFWSWDDYVPGAPDSTVPAGFFPQAKCAVGAPAGPYTPGSKGTWTYTREFANASVFVDLLNRTASHVEFKGSC